MRPLTPAKSIKDPLSSVPAAIVALRSWHSVVRTHGVLHRKISCLRGRIFREFPVASGLSVVVGVVNARRSLVVLAVLTLWLARGVVLLLSPVPRTIVLLLLLLLLVMMMLLLLMGRRLLILRRWLVVRPLLLTGLAHCRARVGPGRVIARWCLAHHRCCAMVRVLGHVAGSGSGARTSRYPASFGLVVLAGVWPLASRRLLVLLVMVPPFQFGQGLGCSVLNMFSFSSIWRYGLWYRSMCAILRRRPSSLLR